MRIERKRGHASIARAWHKGPIESITFDGYETCIHLKDEQGHDLRIVLERAEADRLATFICDELAAQRARIRSLTAAVAALAPEELKT